MCIPLCTSISVKTPWLLHYVQLKAGGMLIPLTGHCRLLYQHTAGGGEGGRGGSSGSTGAEGSGSKKSSSKLRAATSAGAGAGMLLQGDAGEADGGRALAVGWGRAYAQLQTAQASGWYGR